MKYLLYLLLLIPGLAFAQEVWETVAPENGTFTPLPGEPRRVQYGVDTRWVEKLIGTPTARCDNATFTDPAVGMFKSCRMLAGTWVPLAPPPPPPPASAPPAPPVVVAVGPPPVPVLCWPGAILGTPVPGATGSALAWGTVGEVGDWYGWRCPLDQGNTQFVVKMVRKSFKGQPVTTLMNEALRYPRLIDALAAMWNKYDVACELMAADQVAPCQADMKLLAEAAIAGLMPPQVQWIVAKNSTTPTRPAYWVAADALVPTQPAIRVNVGDTCDCTKPFVKGTSTYCNVPPAPATVFALCVKK